MTRSIEKEKESMNALEVTGLSKSFGDFRLQNVGSPDDSVRELKS